MNWIQLVQLVQTPIHPCTVAQGAGDILFVGATALCTGPIAPVAPMLWVLTATDCPLPFESSNELSLF